MDYLTQRGHYKKYPFPFLEYFFRVKRQLGSLFIGRDWFQSKCHGEIVQNTSLIRYSEPHLKENVVERFRLCKLYRSIPIMEKCDIIARLFSISSTLLKKQKQKKLLLVCSLAYISLTKFNCRLFHTLKFTTWSLDRWEYFYSLFVASYFYDKPVYSIPKFDDSDSKTDIYLLLNILMVRIITCL